MFGRSTWQSSRETLQRTLDGVLMLTFSAPRAEAGLATREGTGLQNPSLHIHRGATSAASKAETRLKSPFSIHWPLPNSVRWRRQQRRAVNLSGINNTPREESNRPQPWNREQLRAPKKLNLLLEDDYPECGFRRTMGSRPPRIPCCKPYFRTAGCWAPGGRWRSGQPWPLAGQRLRGRRPREPRPRSAPCASVRTTSHMSSWVMPGPLLREAA